MARPDKNWAMIPLNAFLSPLVAIKGQTKGLVQMTDQTDPIEVIDRFLEALRSELVANPEMAFRMVKALPVSVNFDANEVAKFINPLEVVMHNDMATSKAKFEPFKLADLKKMARQANLATSTDLTGLSKEAVIDLMVDRAMRKIQERSPSQPG